MSATAFILFLAIVALTLVITYFAAKQTKRPMSFTRREGTYRHSKRTGYCGRLHVSGFFPRNCRDDRFERV